MDFIFILDILGLIAFSISGVLTAMKKKLDAFGILIIAFVTSIGGGTLRDVLLKADVTWLTNMTYVYVILITTVFAIIMRNKINYLRKSLFLFDTLGIGLYTVVGVEKGHFSRFITNYMYSLWNDECLFWRCNSRYFM